ncbi:unnamed protein product, partial [Tilletia laevis]
MSIRERISIFLYVCRYYASCRQAGDVFGRSPGSISSAFRSIVAALVEPSIYNQHISLPTAVTPLHYTNSENPRLFPFFKAVVGAIDGSHVRAYAPAEERYRFWNRKGWTSFNVLAACDFDMC